MTTLDHTSGIRDGGSTKAQPWASTLLFRVFLVVVAYSLTFLSHELLPRLLGS